MVSKQTWKFEYDADGRLKKAYNKTKPAEHIDFAFNAVGDLYKTTEYGSNGVAKAETSLSYIVLGQPIDNDRYPLNPSVAPIYDRYLKVFGKDSKHLVRHVTERSLPSNQVTFDAKYSYSLNADGYVTEKKWLNAANGNLISTIPYEYQVSVIW